MTPFLSFPFLLVFFSCPFPFVFYGPQLFGSAFCTRFRLEIIFRKLAEVTFLFLSRFTPRADWPCSCVFHFLSRCYGQGVILGSSSRGRHLKARP